MRKGLIVTVALTLVLVLVGYTLAQQRPQNLGQSRRMMGQGQMDPHAMTHMGHHGMMDPGMGMMGPMMRSPEIMGTMMSIHGEVMTLTGEMIRRYGTAMGEMTPELRQQMHKEMLERMGEILTKHGTALTEKAKTAVK